MYDVELIILQHPDTGDRVRTTPKVFASFYEPQGYVEVLEDDGKKPFVEVSPSGRPLSGAAKAAAERKKKAAQ